MRLQILGAVAEHTAAKLPVSLACDGLRRLSVSVCKVSLTDGPKSKAIALGIGNLATLCRHLWPDGLVAASLPTK